VRQPIGGAARGPRRRAHLHRCASRADGAPTRRRPPVGVANCERRPRSVSVSRRRSSIRGRLRSGTSRPRARAWLLAAPSG
jgi:hypothetical protein